MLAWIWANVILILVSEDVTLCDSDQCQCGYELVRFWSLSVRMWPCVILILVSEDMALCDSELCQCGYELVWFWSLSVRLWPSVILILVSAYVTQCDSDPCQCKCDLILVDCCGVWFCMDVSGYNWSWWTVTWGMIMLLMCSAKTWHVETCESLWWYLRVPVLSDALSTSDSVGMIDDCIHCKSPPLNKHQSHKTYCAWSFFPLNVAVITLKLL